MIGPQKASRMTGVLQKMEEKNFKVKPVYVGGGFAFVVGLIILIVVVAKNSGESKEVVQNRTDAGGRDEGGIKGGVDPKTCAQKVADFEAFMNSGATEEKVREAYEKGLLECPNEFRNVELVIKSGDADAHDNNGGRVNDQTGSANNQTANYANLSSAQVKTLRLKFIREINISEKEPNGPLKEDLKPLHEFLVGEDAKQNARTLLHNYGNVRFLSFPIRMCSSRNIMTGVNLFQTFSKQK